MLDEKMDSSDDKTGFFRKKRKKKIALRIGRYFRSDYIGK